VTLDPYTAHTGPRIIAGAATADSAMALAWAGTVLPGHGEPWHEGITSAVDAARAAGPS
jgi:hypothetical protein